VLQVFAFHHQQVRLVGLLVGPQVAEHLVLVTEAGHAILLRFGYLVVLLKDDASQGQQTAFGRLILAEVVLAVVVKHTLKSPETR
tara:strand:+ start:87108 stop:87362 length:255 start_codon:yes stop_codon:yes gene_type:complete